MTYSRSTTTVLETNTEGDMAMRPQFFHPWTHYLMSLLLILCIGCTIAACGSTVVPGGANQGTLSGDVVAGPTCPVASSEHPCPPKPVPGKEVVIASPTGQKVATATTDAQGHFEVVLTPGDYTVSVAGS